MNISRVGRHRVIWEFDQRVSQSGYRYESLSRLANARGQMVSLSRYGWRSITRCEVPTAYIFMTSSKSSDGLNYNAID